MRGKAGPKGEKGNIGLRGSVGLKGERGDVGQKGENGVKGEVGRVRRHDVDNIVICLLILTNKFICRKEVKVFKVHWVQEVYKELEDFLDTKET